MKLRITILLLAITFIFSFTSAKLGFSCRVQNSQVIVGEDGYGKHVEIKWQTILEYDFGYYTLQRCHPDSTWTSDSSSWHDIARIDTVSTTDSIRSYGFIDYPTVAASYKYRAVIRSNTRNVWAYFNLGEVSASSLTDVITYTDQNVPLEYASVRNYPNPFNPTTNIVIKLQTGERGSLDIFDLNGRKLESLANGSLPAGVHQYQWDASKYPSGIYFCVLRTQNHTSTAKLVLQK